MLPQLLSLTFLAALLLMSPSAHAQEALLGSDGEAALARARPDVEAMYRAIHARPELGKEEHQTKAILEHALREIGYTTFVPSRLAPTAVIAVLDTGRPGRTVALRAEMDARRAREAVGHDPRSQVDGLMHNCGHDAHAAMLLGAARVLFEMRGVLSGRFVFLFQPAEETRGGADDLVREGLLDSLAVTVLLAQHAVARMPVGTVSISQGATLAGSSSFTITVTGESSHAAQPFRGGDVAVAAARIAAGIGDLPARRLDVLSRPAVVSVAHIRAGLADQVNVLPDSAIIRGTIRAFEDVLAPPTPGDPSIAAVLERYVQSTAEAMGVSASLEIVPGPPPTVNDPAVYARLVPALAAVWEGPLDTTPFRGMFAEDFAYYTARTPALYFGLGIARDGFGEVDVHHPNFTIHPDALDVGVRLLVTLAHLESTL